MEESRKKKTAEVEDFHILSKLKEDSEFYTVTLQLA